MSGAADDIAERYLKKAIAEINELGTEISRAPGADGAHVLGSGNPQADVLMLKHRPQQAELQEGVAYFGRAGQAILKSIQRLRIDPMAIYGTTVLKIAGESEEDALGWLARELHIVQAKVIVIMGEDARRCLNALQFPLSSPVKATLGEIQPFTATISALVTPCIDESLDTQDAKRDFWEAFKALGPWWAELPPY